MSPVQSTASSESIILGTQKATRVNDLISGTRLNRGVPLPQVYHAYLAFVGSSYLPSSRCHCLYLLTTYLLLTFSIRISRSALVSALFFTLRFRTSCLPYPSCPSKLNLPILLARSIVAFTAPKSSFYVDASPSIIIPAGSFHPDHPPSRYGISPHRLLFLTACLNSCLCARHLLQSSNTCFTVSFCPHSHS